VVNYRHKVNYSTLKEGKKMDGDKIRIQRVTKRITQKALAEQAHITRSYLSLIENNAVNPSIAVLARIAKVLDSKIDDFF
jgi:transcriptional regulator with XRE-family HTH domain